MHLFWFGSLIGLLAALSAQAGTASALIGLLFAFVGGSVLTWYDLSKTQAVADESERKQRQEEIEKRNKLILVLANTLALGALLGVVIGLSLKSFETYVIQPAVSSRVLANAEKVIALADAKKQMSAADLKTFKDDLLKQLKSVPTLTIQGGSIDELRDIAESIPLNGPDGQPSAQNKILKEKLYNLAEKLEKQGK